MSSLLPITALNTGILVDLEEREQLTLTLSLSLSLSPSLPLALSLIRTSRRAVLSRARGSTVRLCTGGVFHMTGWVGRAALTPR